MKRKFISALVFGALITASTGTFVACSDYDDEIAELRQQISTNATDLKSLVDEKVNNVEVQIDMLESAQAGIEEAYKQADEATQQASLEAAKALVEDARARLQAALDDVQEKVGNAATAADLLEVDTRLTTAVNLAKGEADKAYRLALEVQDMAQTNKENLAILSGNLETLKTSLGQQISTLSGQVTALSTTLGGQISSLVSQMAVLEAYKGTSEADISQLKTDVSNLQSEVESNKQALEDLVAKEVDVLKGQITSVDTKISTLETAYEAADNALQSQIDDLKAKNTEVDGKLVALGERIDKVEGLVNVLFTNLNNLITSIIYQDNTIRVNYAKAALHSNSATESADGKVITFPYNTAKGKTYKMNVGKWYVEEQGGDVYATINPAEVDFVGGLGEGTIKLVNSANEVHPDFLLGAAKDPGKHIVSARSAEEDRVNTANGFYAFELKLKNNGLDEAPCNDEEKYLYGLSTTYQQTNAAGETASRTVTSKYELQVKPTQKAAVTNWDITGVDGSTYTDPAEIAAKGCNTKFSQLTGTITLKDVGVADFFKTYVEVNADDLQYLKGWVDSIYSGEELKRTIEVLPTGVNKPIHITWYVLNYDGTIEQKPYTLIFTQALFGPVVIEGSHYPASKDIQVVDVTADWTKKIAALTDKQRSDFYNNAVARENTMNNLAAVKFYDADGQEITTFNPDAFTKIAKVTVEYDPAKVTRYQDGENIEKASVLFKDQYGNSVVDVQFELTVNQPDHLNIWIGNSWSRRINGAFNALSGENNENLTVAWAQYSKAAHGKAHYALSGSFNDLDSPYYVRDAKSESHGLTLSNMSKYVFDYDAVAHPEYSKSYGLSFTEDPYVVSVDASALKTYGDVEKVQPGVDFALTQDINYYGIKTLDTNIDNFSLRFISAVNYGVYKMDNHSEKEQASYASNTTGNRFELSTLKIYDYSDTENGQPKLMNWNDDRVSKISAELVEDETNNWAFIKNWSGATIDKSNPVITFDVTSTAVIKDAGVKFRLFVTDQFGIVSKHEVLIKINNTQVESARRK